MRCGYDEPIALMPAKPAWLGLHRDFLPLSLFEKDHVVGRNHDSAFLVAICRNCHVEVTELRRQAGIGMQFEADPVKREALRLEALALFHSDTAQALRRWAAEKLSAKDQK